MEKNKWRWEERRERKKSVVDFIHYYQFVFLISVLSFVETKEKKTRKVRGTVELELACHVDCSKLSVTTMVPCSVL